jgi:hypothetical protein
MLDPNLKTLAVHYLKTGSWLGSRVAEKNCAANILLSMGGTGF